MLPALVAAGISAGAGLYAAKRSEKHAQSMFDQNANLSREFAKNGIQWKVADARAAGVHPVYALGAPTHSPSGVALGADYSGISNAGQDFSRAVHATLSNKGRGAAVARTVQNLNLRNMELQNQLLASKIARINSQVGPGVPTDNEASLISGQGNSGINTTPMRRQTSRAGAPWIEAGSVSDVGHARTTTGWAPTFSEDVKQRLEEDWPGVIAWNVRNRLLPTFGANYIAPHKAPPGRYWWYNPVMQQYELLDRKRDDKKWLRKHRSRY